jgi:hypothetical protein
MSVSFEEQGEKHVYASARRAGVLVIAVCVGEVFIVAASYTKCFCGVAVA